MRKFQNVVSKTAVMVLLLAGIQTVQAEIAVITHPGVKEIGVSREQVADIYMGNSKSYPNGVSAKPVDQSSNSPVREKFYKAVVRKSASEVNRHWSRLKFTGKGKPPRVIAGDEAVKNWVARNPGAIGYIEGKYLDKSVNVVLIIP